MSGNKSDHRAKNNGLDRVVDNTGRSRVPIQPHKDAHKPPPSKTAASLQGMLTADASGHFDDEQIADAVQRSLMQTEAEPTDIDHAEVIKQSLLSVGGSSTRPMILLSPKVMNVSAPGDPVDLLTPTKDTQQPKLSHLERVQDEAFHRATNPVADSVDLDSGVTQQVTSPMAFDVMRGLSDTNNLWAPTALKSLKRKKPDAGSQDGCEHAREMLRVHQKNDTTDNGFL